MDLHKNGFISPCLFYVLALMITLNREILAIEKRKERLPKTSPVTQQSTQSHPTQFKPLNLTNSKLDWEGGSFPYEDYKNDDTGSVFYDRAVIVAPIVGSVFIISLVFIGVYMLRQYEIVEFPHEKDVESLCENCSRTTKASGIRYKIQNYVMRIFDVSGMKQEAYFVHMDPRSRTGNDSNTDARETLV